jgi:hypothetical protein
MFIARLLGVLALITVGASLLVYFFTRDRRYLRFGWQVFRFSLILTTVLLLLFLAERLL